MTTTTTPAQTAPMNIPITCASQEAARINKIAHREIQRRRDLRRLYAIRATTSRRRFRRD